MEGLVSCTGYERDNECRIDDLMTLLAVHMRIKLLT